MKKEHARTVFGCASVLLSYPDETSFGQDLAAVAKALESLPTGAARGHLERCCRWLSAMSALEAAATYVEAFDLRRKRSLYLTYYRHGDSRERGLALAALAGAYRAAGFGLAPGELPDYLPALLELAASGEAGQALLCEHKAAVNALRVELEDARSNYAWAAAAVSGALGPLDRAGHAVLARYRELGPPSERVGLEPFAPPEALVPPGDDRGAATVVFSHK
ncbi:MAG TPA: nitrate reductase molybdenum cofactor assembly chaperone [Acidimicrobiales bacterium]|nr:nitrate reductase molybdenum cofactor assembly chaperone [Acidimicrobiales bacterium]